MDIFRNRGTYVISKSGARQAPHLPYSKSVILNVVQVDHRFSGWTTRPQSVP